MHTDHQRVGSHAAHMRLIALAGALAVTTAGIGRADTLKNTFFIVEDLGSLGAGGTSASAINSHGEIVGASHVVPGTWHAYVTTDSPPTDVESSGLTMVDLGTYGGFQLSGANDINDRGHIVGSSYFLFDGEAILWVDGEAMPLGQWPGLPRSEANAINDSGQIVGFAWDDRDLDNARAVFWDRGVMLDIGLPDGKTGGEAEDINNLGVIIGRSWTDFFNSSQGFVLDQAVFTEIPTFGGAFSFPSAINDSNQVVGWATTDADEFNAFLWEDDVMTNLGTAGYTGSGARDINEDGTIVGFAGGSVFFDQSGMLWKDGAAHDLNDFISPDSGWIIHNATAINDDGVITGIGSIGGQISAIVMRPALDLAEPFPGLSGRLNTFETDGATPGATVFLAWGFQQGAASVPGCAGVSLEIQDPRAVSAVADANGRLEITGFVPNGASRVPTLFQAIEPASCKRSPLMDVRFQ